MEQYQDILPLPLAGMFTGQMGRPRQSKGEKNPMWMPTEGGGGGQWKRHPGSEASAKEEEEEEDGQEFSANKVGQEAP